MYTENAVDVLLVPYADLYMGFVFESRIGVELASLREEPAHGVEGASIVLPSQQVKIVDHGAVQPPEHIIFAA